MLSLTELWQAAGSPRGGGPREWLRGTGSGFVHHIAESSGPGRSRAVRGAARGGAGETLAHWQVGCAFTEPLTEEELWELL